MKKILLVCSLLLLVSICCSCGKKYELIDNFTDGYEKADFSKMNSPAEENGLAGTKVYLDGKYSSVKELFTSSGTVFYCEFKASDGNKWLVILDSDNISNKETYNALRNHSLCLKGEYRGFSGKLKLPSINMEQIFDYSTGESIATSLVQLEAKQKQIKHETESLKEEVESVEEEADAAWNEAMENSEKAFDDVWNKYKQRETAPFHVITEEKEETNYNVDVLDTYYEIFKGFSGDIEVSSYAVIKNNSDVNLKIDSAYIDYEDADGMLIDNDSMVNYIPRVLKPGQIGYVYSYYHKLPVSDTSENVNVVASVDVSEAKNYYEVDVDQVAFVAQNPILLDIKVSVRATNNNERDVTYCPPGAIYYDENDKVVGFCWGLCEFLAGETKSFSISGDVFSEKHKSSEVKRVEVYMQGNWSEWSQ